MERCFCWEILEVDFDTVYLFLKETTTPSPCFGCEFQLCISRAMLVPAKAQCCITLVNLIPMCRSHLFLSPLIANFVGMIYLKSTLNVLTYYKHI